MNEQDQTAPALRAALRELVAETARLVFYAENGAEDQTERELVHTALAKAYQMGAESAAGDARLGGALRRSLDYVRAASPGEWHVALEGGVGRASAEASTSCEPHEGWSVPEGWMQRASTAEEALEALAEKLGAAQGDN